jgi:hypothetical protein
VLPLAALTVATLPVLTALVAGLFAARLGGSCLARPAMHRACWALGFLCFSGGAAAEAYGASYGWGGVSFRLYYLLGGVLAVGLLGLGSVWLHLPRSACLVLTGAMAVSVPAAAIAVLSADVDSAALAAAGVAPPPDSALEGLAFLWAVALNSFGTLALVGGSLRSFVRGQRRLANALIVAGVLCVALSGLATRLGSYGFVYVGQLVGLALVFAGFEVAAPRARGLATAIVSRRGA